MSIPFFSLALSLLMVQLRTLPRPRQRKVSQYSYHQPFSRSTTLKRCQYIRLLSFFCLSLYFPFACKVAFRESSIWKEKRQTRTSGSLTHFLALALLSLLSISTLASALAFACSFFSAAVILGTISSNGFSTILIVLIFGGLTLVLAHSAKCLGLGCKR